MRSFATFSKNDDNDDGVGDHDHDDDDNKEKSKKTTMRRVMTLMLCDRRMLLLLHGVARMTTDKDFLPLVCTYTVAKFHLSLSFSR